MYLMEKKMLRDLFSGMDRFSYSMMLRARELRKKMI